MHILSKPLLTLSATALMACGGGGGDDSTTTVPDNSGPVLTVSTTDVTIDGKQFGELPPAVRIILTYDSNVVSIVNMTVAGDAKFEDRNIFSVSSDSSNRRRCSYTRGRHNQYGEYYSLGGSALAIYRG